MARTRSFDEGHVLWAAMDAFRREGFGGVSIKALEAATGLTSGSIYNAYGDKDGLYRAAFNHYIDAVIRRRLETYAGEAAGLDGLEQLFLSMLCSPEADSHGCLLTNAAVEFGARPSVATDGVRDGFALLEQGMRRVLEREIAGDRVDLVVTRLLLLYQGILVLVRAGRDVAACVDVIHAEFNQLREMRS
ncbi:TetR/AcrR family transcriptional regulator [Inquilinus sp. Marseille-Q2685]|uniref:TetR/AcrR family transcriptional regulator n=1 Tax=Inquilinus sp. Marseille-Q2685 TaxID=2866581 RepID=UPI001CE49CF8|nr:TetR/AcrR family transcriptional regulator [Inquilinus sp. Marseille-Q2685]